MAVEKNTIPRSGLPRRPPPPPLPQGNPTTNSDSRTQKETPSATNAKENTTNKRHRRNPVDYKYFPLIKRIKDIDTEYLNSNIYSPGNELYFIKLSELCRSYFQHPKLMQLAQLTMGEEDGDGIGNASFFVCIGTKTAYNSILELPATHRGNKFKSLYIPKSPNYETLFVDFLKQMFLNNETDVLEKTYTRDDVLTISLFYREYKKSKKSGRVLNTDYLLGVASFIIDDEPSCLLAWLGIAAAFPVKKPQQSNLSNIRWDNIRGSLNIGTFLISTCQWLKSLSKGSWLPVVCQVFNDPKGGPMYFYEKLYFVPLSRVHPLIYMQFLRRRAHVIDDDDQLQWYALFQPLIYLTMFEVLETTDMESIQLIVDRGTFFFLQQQMFPFSQDLIIHSLSNQFGSRVMSEQTSFNESKEIADQEFDDDGKKQWIEFRSNEKSGVKLQKVVATVEVLNELLDPDLKARLFPFEQNKIHHSNHLFMLASTAFFGTASYYYIIRQFFYFIYRSLAKLKSTHTFFNTVMPTLATLIINRTYLNSEYDFKRLVTNNGLSKSLKDISDNKSGKILKIYYQKLLAVYSESFLDGNFQGDESDIYFLKEFFNTSFSIIQLSTNDSNPVKKNYM
jgi:hypothetical protein